MALRLIHMVVFIQPGASVNPFSSLKWDAQKRPLTAIPIILQQG